LSGKLTNFGSRRAVEKPVYLYRFENMKKNGTTLHGIDFAYSYQQLLRCACIFPDGLSQSTILEDRAVRNNGIMGSFFFNHRLE